MIYLIGGAPRIGKSIIAKELSQITKIPWLSTDGLRDALAFMLDVKKRNEQFPYYRVSKMTKGNPFKLPTKNLVNFEIKEAKSVKTSLNSLVRHQVLVKDDFILEGVHITPAQVQELIKDKIIKSNVKYIFITPPKDKDLILMGIKKNSSHFDWLKNASDETQEAVANLVFELGNKIRSETIKHKMFYYDRTNNFLGDVKKVVNLLLK